jgi:iron complex outermembrane receptor protein
LPDCCANDTDTENREVGMPLPGFGFRNCLMALTGLVGTPAIAEAADVAQPGSVEELAKLSIEELANVQVTTASKRAEPLAEAPAALYVITEEEIRRSPALSLPQLLRQAPNLDVQRVNARQYAITARGFNGYETANKLLARIDGRSIYSTLAAQIFWELHNPILDDLKQIEVVSGPGGTLYGPNAVNGVINITSKSALDTIGGLARASIASNEQNAGFRYGFGLGSSGAVRAYANYFKRDGLPGGRAGDTDDDFEGIQAGFRMDFDGGQDRFTIQGDVFDTKTDMIKGDGEKGRNLLARWSRELGTDSSAQVQAYYDYFQRDYILVRDRLETFDIEGQINTRLGTHSIVMGAGARTTKDLFINDLNPFRLTPSSERLWICNGFIQDTFAIGPRVDLIAGLKVEHSSFAGFELLPNVGVAWRPSDVSFFWASAARAVRAPTRIDRDLNFLPILATADNFRSEKLWAFEAGYRGQPTARTQLSVNLFFNLYDDLRTTELTNGALPIRLANGMKGSTYGIEAWATHQVMPWWRLRAGIATLHKDLEVKDGRVDLAQRESAGNDPEYRFLVRSQIDLARNLELDVGFRAVDDLKRPSVNSYVEADARLGWRVSEEFELFVAGSNLLHEKHDESAYKNGGQLDGRSVYAGTRVRF